MNKAEKIIALAKKTNSIITSAESCTGGMVAAAITDIAGASDVFHKGFVTYSNQAKTDELGVPPATIKAKGAVSEEVVLVMAAGAMAKNDGNNIIAIAISGIAGPNSDETSKPVGLVWFGVAVRGKNQQKTYAVEQHFEGDRKAVRQAATDFALDLIEQALKAI